MKTVSTIHYNKDNVESEAALPCTAHDSICPALSYVKFISTCSWHYADLLYYYSFIKF